MRRALGLLLAVAVLSGCAARSADRSAAPAAPAPSASATPVPPSPSGSKAAPSPGGSVITLPSGVPKTTAPHEPTDDFSVLTTTGQVRIDGACVELVTDKLTWVLIGPAAAGLRAGQRVRVTGLPDPGFESRCNGSPFKVTTVTPA
jgi:hypothetical protein